jgi:hypothetical protein
MTKECSFGVEDILKQFGSQEINVLHQKLDASGWDLSHESTSYFQKSTVKEYVRYHLMLERILNSDVVRVFNKLSESQQDCALFASTHMNPRSLKLDEDMPRDSLSLQHVSASLSSSIAYTPPYDHDGSIVKEEMNVISAEDKPYRLMTDISQENPMPQTVQDNNATSMISMIIEESSSDDVSDQVYDSILGRQQFVQRLIEKECHRFDDLSSPATEKSSSYSMTLQKHSFSSEEGCSENDSLLIRKLLSFSKMKKRHRSSEHYKGDSLHSTSEDGLIGNTTIISWKGMAKVVFVRENREALHELYHQYMSQHHRKVGSSEEDSNHDNQIDDIDKPEISTPADDPQSFDELSSGENRDELPFAESSAPVIISQATCIDHEEVEPRRSIRKASATVAEPISHVRTQAQEEEKYFLIHRYLLRCVDEIKKSGSLDVNINTDLDSDKWIKLKAILCASAHAEQLCFNCSKRSSTPLTSSTSSNQYGNLRLHSVAVKEFVQSNEMELLHRCAGCNMRFNMNSMMIAYLWSIAERSISDNLPEEEYYAIQIDVFGTSGVISSRTLPEKCNPLSSSFIITELKQYLDTFIEHFIESGRFQEEVLYLLQNHALARDLILPSHLPPNIKSEWQSAKASSSPGSVVLVEEETVSSIKRSADDLHNVPLSLISDLYRGWIKFCCNLDISSWSKHIRSLKKHIPHWMLFQSPADILARLRRSVEGMNTPQVYMKVPGVWTGGHEENLRFRSVNCNQGPGSSEWFGIEKKYVPRLREAVMEQFKVDIIRDEGLWYPNPKWLHDMQIPYYHGIQRAGDVVILRGDTLHWVRSLGFSVHYSWNIGNFDEDQIKVSMDRYHINNLFTATGAAYQSLVPMKTLLLDLSKELASYVAYRLVQSKSPFISSIHKPTTLLDNFSRAIRFPYAVLDAVISNKRLLIRFLAELADAVEDVKQRLIEVEVITGLRAELEDKHSSVTHCDRRSCRCEIFEAYILCSCCGYICLSCAVKGRCSASNSSARGHAADSQLLYKCSVRDLRAHLWTFSRLISIYHPSLSESVINTLNAMQRYHRDLSAARLIQAAEVAAHPSSLTAAVSIAEIMSDEMELVIVNVIGRYVYHADKVHTARFVNSSPGQSNPRQAIKATVTSLASTRTGSTVLASAKPKITFHERQLSATAKVVSPSIAKQQPSSMSSIIQRKFESSNATAAPATVTSSSRSSASKSQSDSTRSDHLASCLIKKTSTLINRSLTSTSSGFRSQTQTQTHKRSNDHLLAVLSTAPPRLPKKHLKSKESASTSISAAARSDHQLVRSTLSLVNHQCKKSILSEPAYSRLTDAMVAELDMLGLDWMPRPTADSNKSQAIFADNDNDIDFDAQIQLVAENLSVDNIQVTDLTSLFNEEQKIYKRSSSPLVKRSNSSMEEATSQTQQLSQLSTSAAASDTGMDRKRLKVDLSSSFPLLDGLRAIQRQLKSKLENDPPIKSDHAMTTPATSTACSTSSSSTATATSTMAKVATSGIPESYPESSHSLDRRVNPVPRSDRTQASVASLTQINQSRITNTMGIGVHRAIPTHTPVSPAVIANRQCQESLSSSCDMKLVHGSSKHFSYQPSSLRNQSTSRSSCVGPWSFYGCNSTFATTNTGFYPNHTTAAIGVPNVQIPFNRSPHINGSAILQHNRSSPFPIISNAFITSSMTKTSKPF